MKAEKKEPYGGHPPFQVHSDTSERAATAIASDAITLRSKVWRYLSAMGRRGATDEEMQMQLNMGANTQRPRRRELELKGLVLDSGRRRTTLSGRAAVVWIINHVKNPSEDEI